MYSPQLYQLLDTVRRTIPTLAYLVQHQLQIGSNANRKAWIHSLSIRKQIIQQIESHEFCCKGRVRFELVKQNTRYRASLLRQQRKEVFSCSANTLFRSSEGFEQFGDMACFFSCKDWIGFVYHSRFFVIGHMLFQTLQMEREEIAPWTQIGEGGEVVRHFLVAKAGFGLLSILRNRLTRRNDPACQLLIAGI